MALRNSVNFSLLLRQAKNLSGITAARPASSSTTNLKEAIAAVIPEKKEVISSFKAKYGKEKVGDVTIDMMYRGMRGITGLVNEISDVDVEGGIRFRGHTVEECRLLLPKSPNGQEPLPEGFFWLLCTGQIPNDDQVAELSKEWAQRAQLPPHVADMLNKFPGNLNTMTQFCAAVTACNSESKFVTAYHEGHLTKSTFWEYMYEDSMDMIAKLPTIAAIIYRNLYRDGSTPGVIDPTKDWAWNFCTMLGYDRPKMREYLRLYLSAYCEHGGGSICTHTSRLVGSALSDAYLSFSSGVAGLAGPVHGAANQEAMIYLTNVQRDLGTDYTKDQLKDYLRNTIRSGQVIPGYGHAILRKTDPRYAALLDFLKTNFPNDPLFKLSSDLYKLVPHILMEDGKAKNPWPNVDAVSGVGLYHYGLTELEFHPIFIAMSRSLGSMASLIWDRILGMPIERPKSMSTENLMKMVKAN